MSDTFFVEKGQVKEVVSSQTKNGNLAYRVKVYDPNEKVEDTIGMGFEKPPFGEGAVISFEAEQNGKFINMNVDTLEVHEAGQTAAGRSPGRSSRGGRGDSQRSSGRGGRGGNSNNSRSGGTESAGRSGGNNRSDAGNKSAGLSKDEWAAKDKRIELMSARNSSLEFLKIALEQGAVSLGSKKAADKLELLEAVLDKITMRFLSQNEQFVTSGSISVGEASEEDDDVPFDADED